MVPHILSRAQKSQIQDEPHPHLVLENALPDDYYAALHDSYPSLEEVAGVEAYKNNFLYLLSAAEVLDNPRIPAIWRDFFATHCSEAFFRVVCDFWRERIGAVHPDLARRFSRPLDELSVGLRKPGKRDNPENRRADIMMDCQFGVNSPVREVSTVRGPHVDNWVKLFAALLYFRHPQDDSTGGNLELFKLKPNRRYPRREMRRVPPRYLEKAVEVPYRANTLVMWLNSPYSIHGVSPRAVTSFSRRYVNFLGEAYAGIEDPFYSV